MTFKKKKKPEERVIFSAGQDLHYLKRVAESALLKMKGACSALGWDGSSSVQNVRSHCLAPALPWSQLCVSSKLSALGQGRGCLPSSTAPQLLRFDLLGCACQRSSSCNANYRFSSQRNELPAFDVTAPATWATAAQDENILDHFDWLPSRLY